MGDNLAVHSHRPLGVAVSRHLIEGKGEFEGGEPGTSSAAADEAGGARFWAGRAVDIVCWISVWMSSQTAIWVTCGVAGVFLGWLAAGGASRLFLQEMKGRAESPGLPCRDGMRARNG